MWVARRFVLREDATCSSFFIFFSFFLLSIRNIKFECVTTIASSHDIRSRLTDVHTGSCARTEHLARKGQMHRIEASRLAWTFLWLGGSFHAQKLGWSCGGLQSTTGGQAFDSCGLLLMICVLDRLAVVVHSYSVMYTLSCTCISYTRALSGLNQLSWPSC